MNCRGVFGFKADLKPNIAFIDNDTLIYAVGNNLVILYTDDNTQKIIPSSSSC